MKEKRLHYQMPEMAAGTHLCGQVSKGFSVTTNPANVTCKRCLSILADLRLRRFDDGPVPEPNCTSLMPPGAEHGLKPRPLKYRPCFINMSLAFGAQSIKEHLVERHAGDAEDLAKFKPDDLWRIHDRLHIAEGAMASRRIRALERRLEELCK